MALSLDAAKIQANAMSKVLEMADLNPETLAKTFKDFGESPEKLRALLNLWFTPWAKPSFVQDRDYAVAGLRDVEFLGTADLPPGQRPYRMFDIETGNLVEYPAIGVRGQYCMLSHRWKGVEVSLSYIRDARRKELERAREAARNGQTSLQNKRKSDVQLAVDQCRLDIEEQEGLIKELGGEEAVPLNIGDLLSRRLDVRSVEYKLGSAKDDEDKKTTKLRFAKMEQKIFSHLVNQMQDRVDEEMEAHLGKSETHKASAHRPSGGNLGGEVITEIEAEIMAAAGTLKKAQDKHDSAKIDIEYFQRHPRLRDALDEMVCRLQRWKSVIKIDRAIQEADRIFKTKLFRDREKCYLWTDPCCIDKSNGGELSESLSLMGDWYADAEFTLVQLDTRFNEEDAVKDWDRFQAERRNKQPLDEPPNIQDFRDIKKYGPKAPEWSTRAWTLQELVMSKTTFYVNSLWSPLSRPVESLGYFYYLIPFIALYTGGDTRNIYRFSCQETRGFWDSENLTQVLGNAESLDRLDRFRKNIQVGGSPTKGTAFSEVSRVETAQQLIALLDVLGVRIPGSLTMETATSEVTRAVYLASADLAGDNENAKRQREHYLRLKKCLPEPDLTAFPKDMSEQERTEEVAQHALNFILQCLVAETEDLVLADRQWIAEFGHIQQTYSMDTRHKPSWILGSERVGAVRNANGLLLKPTSRSTKALTRLLDEVVISRNDISVFNWTGMEMGSPIRGRSMYPSSPRAYGKQVDRGRRYNFLLAARVQDKMDDVMTTYHSVIRTLRSAIDSLKDKERKSLPINWIERIVQIVRLNGFRELKPQQEGFEKIVAYVREYCRRERLEQQAKAKAAKLAESAASPPPERGSSLLKMPTIPSVTSLSAPSLSLSGFMSSASPKKVEESSGSVKKASKFGLGKGLKSSSFGFSKKGESSTVEEQPAIVEAPATPQASESPDVMSDPPPPYAAVDRPPAQPSWQDFDGQVMDYLAVTPAERLNKTLPPELQSINFDLDKSERPTAQRHGSEKDSFERQDFNTISPNPIIVNNSGIEGLFDIQRVVVTMIDPEKLRRQIAKAAGPHDKISGWCSISTGFARVITSFACERRILEQELDVIESVGARVLQEQDKGKGDKRSAKILHTLSVTNTTTTTPTPAKEDAAAPNPANPPDATTNTPTDPDKGTTEEERLVGRMIAFISRAAPGPRSRASGCWRAFRAPQAPTGSSATWSWAPCRGNSTAGASQPAPSTSTTRRPSRGW
ncbi:hypothetical protein CHGG_09884 [Chaetomium globosum CBS 148.51]|uniref:Heterokaryon incompatibility domain-containing protein n=1 Tax=Chaetomium globosum (strain ATCC 6205 / CBS 148.51 / DSM 1962 / NBRC 6347 / NRRL 1970) TaxID=306901 RepID=Q2GQ70_CHAGB|nr:uncharacterized protein CHGG_09884 [Chaetomium globosum CBS 148.51]EAQ83480.1 hypothetical protein CHGG_09884 [Chaetomium globosum CBS 148.51]